MEQPRKRLNQKDKDVNILLFHLRRNSINYITNHLVINDGIVVESLGFYLSEEKNFKEENLKEKNKEEYVANKTEYLEQLKTLKDMPY